MGGNLTLYISDLSFQHTIPPLIQDPSKNRTTNTTTNFGCRPKTALSFDASMSAITDTRPLLISVAYTLGFLSTFLGLLSILFPGASGQLLGLQTSPHSANFSTTASYTAAKGARDIAVGLCYVVFAATRNLDGVKTVIAATVLVGAVDTMLVWKQGRRGRAWLLGLGSAMLAGYLVFGCMQ